MINYSEQFINLLKTQKIREALSKKDFKSLYSMIEESLTPQFTDFCLHVLKVNPLEYMDYIPKKFLCESEIAEFTIPDSITSIGNYAFSKCKSLKSIIIPNSITSIGEYAFYGCSSLKNITIGNGITHIPSRTFWYCDSLESIKIPDSVTYINAQAFGHCTSLKSIEIPDSLTEIGTLVFANCRLVTINYNGTMKQWRGVHHWGPLTDTGRLINIICTDGEIESR